VELFLSLRVQKISIGKIPVDCNDKKAGTEGGNSCPNKKTLSKYIETAENFDKVVCE